MFWFITAICTIATLFGLLAIAGGAMSDAPTEGDASAKGGAITVGICLVVQVLACIARAHGWLPV